MNTKCRYRASMNSTSPLRGRLRREHETFVRMARIYCRRHHQPVMNGLCPECVALMQYAERRLEKCPYEADKPTCANCPVHCYKPAQRERARAIMRFAGPRMPWRHPLRALTHLFDKRRQAQHPMKLRRERARLAAVPAQAPGSQASDRNQERPAPSKP
jgi:hypothetical protein